MKNKLQFALSMVLVLSMLLSSAASFAPQPAYQESPTEVPAATEIPATAEPTAAAPTTAPVTVKSVTVSCPAGTFEINDMPASVAAQAVMSDDTTVDFSAGPGSLTAGADSGSFTMTYTGAYTDKSENTVSGSCSISVQNTLKSIALYDADGKEFTEDTAEKPITFEIRTTDEEKDLSSYFTVSLIGKEPTATVKDNLYQIEYYTARDGEKIADEAQDVIAYNTETHKIKPLKAGEVWLRISQVNNDSADAPVRWVKIVVTDGIIHVTGISFTSAAELMRAGESKAFTAAVTPAEATDPSVTYASSDPAVLSVAEDGTVSALTAGSAVITASSVAAPEFAVTQNVSVTAISAGTGLSEHEVSLVVGQSVTISKVYGSETDQAAAFTLAVGNSDVTDNVFSEDQQSLILTGKAAGTNYVYMEDGKGFKDTCTVTVYNPISAITLSADTIAIDETTETLPTLAITSTDKAEGSPEAVNWAFDPAGTVEGAELCNENICLAPATGEITPLSDGTTTVSAVSTVSGVSSSAVVTVSGIDALYASMGEVSTMDLVYDPTKAVTPANITSTTVQRGYGFNLIQWNTTRITTPDINDPAIDHYEVWRNGGTSAIYRVIQPDDANVKTLNYKDNSLDSNVSTTYSYLVKACTDKMCSTGDFIPVSNASAVITVGPALISITNQNNKPRNNQIYMEFLGSYTAINNAIAIYRLNTSTGLKSAVDIITSGTDYTDTTMQNGVDYTYSFRYCTFVNDPYTDALCGAETVGTTNGYSLGNAISTIPAPTLSFPTSQYGALTIQAAASGAVGFYFEISSDSSFISGYQDEYVANGNTFTFKGLDEARTYYVRVTGLSANAEISTNSTSTNADTLTIPAPTITSAPSDYNNMIPLRWSLPNYYDAPDGYPNRMYKVEYSVSSTGGYRLYEDPEDTTIYTSTGVDLPFANNTTYYLRMNTCFYTTDTSKPNDKICGKTYSAVASATPRFKAPVINSNSYAGPQSAYIEWNAYDFAAVGVSLDHYRVEYKLSSSSEWLEYLNSRSLKDRFVWVSPLVTGATYDFRVYVIDSNGYYSQPSNVVSYTIPGFATPANFNAAAGASSVRLTWTAVSGADQYEVCYKNTSDPTYTCKTAEASSYLVEGLTTGTAYNFRLRALKRIHNRLDIFDDTWQTIYSGYTGDVSQIPNILPPTNLKITVNGYHKIGLSWTGSVDGVTYRVYQSPTSNGSGYDVVWEGTGLTAMIEGLNNSTTYSFYVASVANGSSGQSTSVSNTVSATTGTLNPPNNVTVSAHNKTAVFTWTNVSGLLTYRIVYAKSTGSLVSPSSCPATNSADAGCVDIKTSDYNYNGYQYPVGGLDNDVKYNFRVYTVDENNEISTNYRQVSLSPAFKAVKNIIVIGAPYSVMVSWTPHEDLNVKGSRDNVGSYVIRISTDPKMTNAEEVTVSAADAGCTSNSNTRCQKEILASNSCKTPGSQVYLDNGKKYYFTVQAKDVATAADGQIAYKVATNETSYISNRESAKLTELKPPSGIKAVAAQDRITITWDLVSNFNTSADYKVYGKVRSDKTADFKEVACSPASVDLSTGTASCIIKKVPTGKPINEYTKYSFNVRSAYSASITCPHAEDLISKKSSKTVTVTPKVTKLSGIRYKANMWHAIELTWKNYGYDSYKVEVSTTNRKSDSNYFNGIQPFIVTTNSIGLYGSNTSKPTTGQEYTGLTEGSTYYFRITPMIGTTEITDAQSRVFRVKVPVMPGPSSLKLEKTYGNNNVKLTWNPVKNVSHYRVQRATDPNGTWTDINGWQAAVPSASSPATPQVYYDTTKLDNGVTYYYRVYSGISYTASTTPLIQSSTHSNTVSVRY